MSKLTIKMGRLHEIRDALTEDLARAGTAWNGTEWFATRADALAEVEAKIARLEPAWGVELDGRILLGIRTLSATMDAVEAGDRVSAKSRARAAAKVMAHVGRLIARLDAWEGRVIEAEAIALDDAGTDGLAVRVRTMDALRSLERLHARRANRSLEDNSA